MSLSIRSEFDVCREIAYTDITSVFVQVGAALDNPTRQIFVTNSTDVTLMFSFNGVDDHFPLLSSGLFVKDTTSNKSTNAGFYIPRNKALYVRYIAGVPTTGSVYFANIFGFENNPFQLGA